MTASTQLASCTFRGFLLERCSHFAEMVPNVLDGCTIPLISFTGNGLVKIANSESGTEDWAFHISPIEPDAVWLHEVYID